ncbi:hypothetical protein BRADI_4g22580v3 [Brachypodium distachyon]|uniref:Protein kinase domain-containing protein n=1 Tax=Brachypodium distachyon TaxID=15368 RepID=I1IML8_BRADI|nr:hypothetical protein BRADI_4g22580v3 [Brachypodium distachyon]
MEPKITDFGVSRCFEEGISRVFTKHAPGTLRYIAPEILDKGEISFKSDIYGLGIIIIQLLTGCDRFDYQNTKKGEALTWHTSIELDGPQVKICIEIAQMCMDLDQHKRPTISDIIDKLHEIEIMIQNSPQTIQDSVNDPGSIIYQSTGVNEGLATKDITEGMFNKEECEMVHEVIHNMPTIHEEPEWDMPLHIENMKNQGSEVAAEATTKEFDIFPSYKALK